MLLGTGVIDFQLAGQDQEISLTFSGRGYIVRRITVSHASHRPVGATAAVWSLSDGGGNAVVADGATFTSLLNTIAFEDLPIAAGFADRFVLDYPSLYFRLSAPADLPATGLITVWGDEIPT